MREKTLKLIITFHTTAAAMAMEKICAIRGLPGRLGPVPRSVTSDCGIAWWADPEERFLFETGEDFPEFEGIYEVLSYNS
mgnify:CR=1 FL=1